MWLQRQTRATTCALLQRTGVRAASIQRGAHAILDRDAQRSRRAGRVDPLLRHGRRGAVEVARCVQRARREGDRVPLHVRKASHGLAADRCACSDSKGTPCSLSPRACQGRRSCIKRLAVLRLTVDEQLNLVHVGERPHCHGLASVPVPVREDVPARAMGGAGKESAPLRPATAAHSSNARVRTGRGRPSQQRRRSRCAPSRTAVRRQQRPCAPGASSGQRTRQCLHEDARASVSLPETTGCSR